MPTTVDCPRCDQSSEPGCIHCDRGTVHVQDETAKIYELLEERAEDEAIRDRLHAEIRGLRNQLAAVQALRATDAGVILRQGATIRALEEQLGMRRAS